MRNRKCTKPKRLLSFFLAVLVAVSILPMSWLQASAATEKHPDAVTITVTDGNGKALADAVVNYTIESQTDVENPISGIVMTDEDGCAEVLSGDDYKENDLELTAQVSKEHYESNDTAIVSLPITSADQNFEVSLRCMLIEDVTVTGVTEAYADGKKFPAATVEGIVTDGEHPDKVTYELYTYEKDETTGKDEWVSAGQTSELPQISEVGNYKLAVSVDRGEQYEIYRTEVDSEITLGKITDYTITPLNETYTGAKEGQELPKYDAVTVTGGRKTDNVTYKLGTGEKTETIPQIQYAGTYSVTVRVERENYEPFEQTYTAVLKSKANEYKGTYDGKYHRLIESVEGTDPNNKDVVVEYSVSEKKEESSWSREVPKGVNAGSYPVYIRIDRDNDGKFEETIDAIATIDPVSIELKNISDEIPESVTYEEARNRTYDYSVKAFGVDDQEFDSSVVKITYSIESAEKEDSSEESGDTEGTETGNASTDMKEIATIDEGGQLQVQEAGGGHSIYVVVKVELKDTCSEKNNYIKKTRKTQLDIVQMDGLLKFEENGNIVSSKKYVFGTNNGIISNLKAWKSEKDNGTITYSTTVNGEDSENYGISIDKTSGKLSISNYENLAEKLVDNNGALTVKVTAHKTAGTKWVRKGFGLWAKKVLYEEADADYSINIQFEATPENSFSLKSSESADAETITANEAGWFQQAVYVVPAEGYQIASEWKNDATKTLNAMSCVVFNNQGESERIVYLKSTTTGGITAPIKTGIEKIDSVRPDAKDIEITYSASTSPILEMLNKIFHFYDKTGVEVTITAKDATSGIKALNWIYTRADDASDSNLEQASGTLTDIAEVKTDRDKKVYQATLLLPVGKKDQLNGNLQVQAVDAADLSSDYMTDTVDAVQDKEKPEQFSATVVLPRGDADQLRGNFIYAATDKCKKEIKNPIVDNENVIVVDTKVPTMTATYTTPSRKEGNHWYYNKNIDLTFAVTEANFYAEDVKVELSRNAGATYTEITPAWTDESVDLHIGTYTIPALKNHSNDADYKIRVTYEDRSGNVMKEYVSNVMTIDTKAPIISVSYTNKDVKNVLADAEGHNRSYFNATQTATVTINEHNFVGKEVDYTIIAKDVTGKVLNADALCQKSGWTDRGDIHTMTITYPGDANYTFDVAYADLATNQATDYSEDYFTVDKTVPSGLTVTYSPSILDTALNGISYGFYNAKVRVTLTANDDIAGVHDFKYAYTKAAGVSAVNAELINQIIEEAGITYSADGRTATSTFEIPKNALTNDTQFNGTVQFTAKDRSENESGELADTKRLVVDNIAPTANVEYNTPVHQENGISYYDGAVTATVTMNEANFYPEDVVVSVTKDGVAYSVSPSWSDQGTDVHIGTFTLSEDGDYFITMNYRDKSSNQMVEYSSEQLTVDTEITAPVITVNGEEANGRAFKNEVVPAVSFNDINFDSYKITLTRTRYDVKDEDVTEKYIGSAVALDGQGGSGSFDTFEKEAGTDGIYTMIVSMTDKAGHSAETTATFTVNRFGSVYVYNDQLIDLIQDGGAYVQPSAIKDDLVITEYNADRLLADSLDIEVLCDGKPMADTDYSVTPEINDQAPIGSSGWYQYQYTIAKENFAKDGVYKIAVASKDATGNSPETTNYEDKEILFHVDGTAPEITSIAGLEDTIINAQSVDATYSVYDTMGLKSIKVLVDGKVVDEITDFSADRNNYEGDFVVNESKDKQKVELVVTDLAGNVTDTDSEEFKEACAYEFNDVVTISTNPMVRAMAWIKDHAKVIAGTVAVVAAIVAGIIVLVLVRRRKDSEDDSESGGNNSDE